MSEENILLNVANIYHERCVEDGYRFTEDWFGPHVLWWESILEKLQPKKILEIGSFEGRATCFIIEKAGQTHPLEIHCIDTWKGGQEHDGINFANVESNFDFNITLASSKSQHPVAIHKRVGTSLVELSRLVVDGVKDFDLIYVDGSHQASDVFVDAALSFRLLRMGGLLIFDDNIDEPDQTYNYPRIAIQAFIDAHENKIHILSFDIDGQKISASDMYQMYIQKIA